MAYEQVDVYVEDESRTPVSGALVRVYDKVGRTLFTEARTSEDGKVGFLLWAGEYSLRFYKFQTSFRQPQLLTVQTDPQQPGVTLNAFTVRAESFVPPVSSDPRFCRLSGFFRTPDGRPLSRLRLQFSGVFPDVLLEQAAVVSGPESCVATRTDESGYACIDLIRCAEYFVDLGPGTQWKIQIPDSSSACLPVVLYSYVASVSFAESVFSVNKGETLKLTPTVLDAAGVVLPGTASGQLRWSSTDPSIAAVSSGGSELSIYGGSPGTCELFAERLDTSVVRIPEVPIRGIPIEITVV